MDDLEMRELGRYLEFADAAEQAMKAEARKFDITDDEVRIFIEIVKENIRERMKSGEL